MFKTPQVLFLTLNLLEMKTNYENEHLGLSRTEIRKEWESCWDRIQKVNPIRDYKELEELNKRFEKCVEAYYSVDCGDHWVVSKATDVKRKYGTFKVMKVS